MNRSVGGQPSSQHCRGEAADLIALEKDLKEFAQAVLTSDLQFDQLIYEYGGWVHISYVTDRAPRRQALMIGKWTAGKYEPLDLEKVPE